MNRDNQFAGSAKAVYEKFVRNVLLSDKGMDIEAFKQEQETILARAGYALVKQAIDEAHSVLNGNCTDCYEHITAYDVLRDIPDMPTLPEETTK
jgi:hypothetical protein